MVERLNQLLEAGERDELVASMGEVAGLPPDQVELLRSLPAWKARIAVADTIPREELGNRTYAFEPERFGELRVPTSSSSAATAPSRSASRRRRRCRLCPTAG